MQPNNSEKNAPIIGIGASAGGLKALKKFFYSVPEDSGLAYVVVVHLSPEHKSVLADLLQPNLKIPVVQVKENVEIKSNHVYVIPPNANLDTIDTHLRPSKLEEKRSERAPIDHFFRTLARTHEENAIGVILTGTGSDGTLGLKEIKEKGGLTIVQNPQEAEYDGMPQSAISTGLIDLVLPLAEIPDYIMRYTGTSPRLKFIEEGEKPNKEDKALIQRVFAQVKARTGRDFSRYKLSTILRRLQRRMQIYQLEELDEYLEILRKNPEEVRALSDDFLINVTNFFRDANVFSYLEKNVIPNILKKKNEEDEVRIWSVGCASGEEAYSLAMLFAEAVDDIDTPPTIQIFASDLHENALKKARDGFFPGDIQVDVSLDRLKRFFNKEDGGYRIRKELREQVVFTPHNLLSDPPFSRLDMVVCRNLLIYLQRDVQKDIFELFHYALLPSGYMVLGTSESQETNELFRTESKELSVFRKKNISGPEPKLPVFPRMNKSFHEKTNEDSGQPVLSPGILHHKMVERYGPPSLLLSPDYEVMHVSENAGRYLRIQGGDFSRDLFKLVRTEFSPELRSVLHLAKEEKTTVRSKPIDLQIDGKTQRLILSVRVMDDQANKNMILVMFEEYDLREKLPTNEIKEKSDAVTAKRIEELEEELNEKRQQLQSIIEEYETSREEMKASNEELQSSNEELHSTTEELETSKEELQSVNEELTTLNQENRHKVEELSQMSDDLQNLLASTQIATLFLNREFRIMRYTPRLGELFNIRPADRGRLISDITNKMNYDALVPDAKKVIKSLQPVEREIEDTDGNTYLTRLLPYRSTDDKIDGVVITFIDISGRINAEKELEKEKTYAESIFETMHEPLLVLNPDLTVKSANPAFYDHFKVKEAETIGRRIYHLGNNQWDIPALRKLLEDVLPDSNVFNDFEVDHKFEDIGRRVMLVNARRLDHVQMILLGIRDITERKQDEEKIRSSEERLRLTLNELGIGSWVLEENADKTFSDEINNELYGFEKDTSYVDVENMIRRIHPEDLPVLEQAVKEAWSKNGEFSREYRILIDGKVRWLTARGKVILDDTRKMIGINYDITERKWREVELRIAKERYQNLFDSIDEGFCIFEVIFDKKDKAVDFRFLETNPAFEKHTGLKNAEGKRIRELVPKHEEYWFETYGRIAKTGQSERFVNHAKYLDNRWFDIYAFSTGEPHENKVAAIFNDITQQRRHEKELKEAKTQAEDAARAREEFLAHMSHEIRTPLTAIVLISHLLLELKPRKDQLDNLRALKTAADNLNRLINDILDYSKVRAGKVSLDTEKVVVDDLVGELLSVHGTIAQEKDIELKTEIDEEIPELIVCDKLKLSQILNNLLSNALKFTDKGTVALGIKLVDQKADDFWLEFSVSDTGIGIHEEKRESIFELFSQADNSTVKKYGGTGLGLTLTKIYLEMMGSEIQLESKPGKGSRFYFVLYVRDHVKAKEGKEQIEEESGESLKGLRVLIVEDDDFNRLMAVQFFKIWELNYDEAINGLEALEKAKRQKYDLVLMDIRMPEMDGYESTIRIKKLPGYDKIPVVALTADVTSRVEKELEAGRFADVIHKPFDPDNMKAKIVEVLNRS